MSELVSDSVIPLPIDYVTAKRRALAAAEAKCQEVYTKLEAAREAFFEEKGRDLVDMYEYEARRITKEEAEIEFEDVKIDKWAAKAALREAEDEQKEEAKVAIPPPPCKILEFKR